MRIRELISFVLAGAFLAFPASALAQKFQEPTKEELQMTSDPKAPGAPAVYLDRELTVNNDELVTTEHARIKILSESGKEWATVEFPYDPRFHGTPALEGRTIHVDGSVIPLAGKPEDLIGFRGRKEPSEFYDPIKVAFFTLPGAEIGSIVEYTWSLRTVGPKKPTTAKQKESRGLSSGGFTFSIPRFDVQRDIFIHKEHFHYLPYNSRLELNGAPRFTNFKYGEVAKYFLFAARLPADAHVEQGPNHDYTLDLSEVSPISREPDSPAVRGRAYSVQFYYTPYFTAADLWPNQIRQWSGLLKENIGKSASIQQAAAQITAGAATAEEKARKLYEAVQALDNTDFSRPDVNHGDLDAKTPEEAWKDKSGSGNDLAELYLALARAAGIEAYGAKAVDRSRGAFDPNWLSLDQFVNLLVLIKVDGKDVYLDPGEKFCPFGQLHWTHMLTAAAIEGAKEPSYTPPNQTKDAITAHTADLVVDANGAVTGTAKVLMNGPAALYWRQLNLTADPTEALKQFKVSLHQLLPQGVFGEVERLQGLDTSAGFLSATVKVSGQLGIATGKRILLPAFFFSQAARPQLVSEGKRETAVDLHYAEQVIDDVVYHLPAGFAVESAPAAAQLPWPDHAALVVKSLPTPGAIDIKHTYARAFVMLDPKEYPALRDYYQKLATTDRQQVVLLANSNSGDKLHE